MPVWRFSPCTTPPQLSRRCANHTAQRNYRTFLLFIYGTTIYIMWTFGISLWSFWVKARDLRAAGKTVDILSVIGGRRCRVYCSRLSSCFLQRPVMARASPCSANGPAWGVLSLPLKLPALTSLLHLTPTLLYPCADPAPPQHPTPRRWRCVCCASSSSGLWAASPASTPFWWPQTRPPTRTSGARAQPPHGRKGPLHFGVLLAALGC